MYVCMRNENFCKVNVVAFIATFQLFGIRFGTRGSEEYICLLRSSITLSSSRREARSRTIDWRTMLYYGRIGSKSDLN